MTADPVTITLDGLNIVIQSVFTIEEGTGRVITQRNILNDLGGEEVTFEEYFTGGFGTTEYQADMKSFEELVEAYGKAVSEAKDPAEAAARERLVRMTCKGFANETASESPAPGGGSISAYMGALGAALGTMVANLSSHKAGWDARWKEFSDWADKGQAVMNRLLALVDEDTAAFDKIMAALGMPKGSDEEKAARAAALEAATLYATEVPLKTMKASLEVFPIVKAMATEGNPASVSDAGVGALAARSAVLGAQMNVRINAAGLADKAAAEKLCAEAAEIAAAAIAAEAEVLEIVNAKL